MIGKYLPGNFKDLILYEKYYPFKEETPTIHIRTHISPAVDVEMKPGEPFYHIEEMPQFPGGGDEALLRFIEENTHYPESACKAGIKGRVILRCVIEKDGTIRVHEVARKLSPECDEEAVRVIKSMPKWIPGRHQGEPAAVYYTILIHFGPKNSG